MSKDHLSRSYRAPSTISVLLETVTFPNGNATSSPDLWYFQSNGWKVRPDRGTYVSAEEELGFSFFPFQAPESSRSELQAVLGYPPIISAVELCLESWACLQAPLNNVNVREKHLSPLTDTLINSFIQLMFWVASLSPQELSKLQPKQTLCNKVNGEDRTSGCPPASTCMSWHTSHTHRWFLGRF